MEVDSSVFLFFFNYDFDQWFIIFLPLESYLKIFVLVEKDIIYQNIY